MTNKEEKRPLFLVIPFKNNFLIQKIENLELDNVFTQIFSFCFKLLHEIKL